MDLIGSLLDSLHRFSEQGRLLACNIANVNTHAFKAQSIASSTNFASRKQLSLHRTSDAHILSAGPFYSNFRVEQMQGEEKPNGNNVNLLRQMNAMSKNCDMYELSSALFSKAFDFLHIAQGGSGK